MSYLPLQAVPLLIRGAASSITGTTSDTSLRSITLKANTMGPYDMLEIWSMWNVQANNANAKTATIKFGSTTYLSMSLASTRAFRDVCHIYAAGATNAQRGFSISDNDSTGASTAVVASTEDTTTDLLIDFRGQLGVGTDTITCDQVAVILWKRS
jgi:hypothetical protein